MEAPAAASTAVRVLSRGPFPPPSASSTSPPDGVVAVGFFASTASASADLTQLINRVLDARTFGSSQIAADLLVPPPNGSDWFRHRKVSYHYDAEKAVVFLHFSSSLPSSLAASGEEQSEDLKGLLFMFSVCHVIIFLHDGLRIDTNLLKTFRLLQTAKQALSKSNSNSAAISNINASLPQLIQRGNNVTSQSSPVILFVLQENLSDASMSVSTTESAATTFGKTDTAFRKRLIASLDAQLRFLMKKLHLSLRVTGKSSYPPLFSLDASRVVTLLDRAANRRGEPLNFLTSLIDASMTSKSAFEFITNENTSHFINNEEVQVIRDFIFRQSEVLRGRGGGGAINTNSGSVPGVGTVAAAAIAAVTSSSSSSVKPNMGVDLPSLDKWLLTSSLILSSLTSPKIDSAEGENENSYNIEATLSCLDRGTSISTKFSISWCESALPKAREVYLHNLPLFYRTCTHEEHLSKAIETFRASVKGSAVNTYVIKLERECNSIWENDRQQCDVMSLTGRPCMLQRHKLNDAENEIQHCSGYLFLHACACGRSRALRDDPFDIETANIKFCVLPKCEVLLPSIKIPSVNGENSVMANAWRLMRIGGGGYYKPEKGLLQTGFCTREKYLFQWKIRNTSDNDTVDQLFMVQCSDASTEGRGMHHHLNENVKKHVAADLGINFGKGIPSSTTKKPFAEVVASKMMIDSEFPALQKMHSKTGNNYKDTRQNKFNGSRNDTQNDNKIFSKDVQAVVNNIVPEINKDEGTKENRSIQEFRVFVGFEHECPHGHRFILSEKHLKGLESFSLSEKNHEKNMGNKNGFPTKNMHSRQHVRGYDMTDDDNEKFRDGGRAFSLLNRRLPIYMNCPHCARSEKQNSQQVKFAGTTSQLQRIFIVTPPFPVLLATCPVVQFEDSCLPQSVPNRDQNSKFGFNSRVMLPPDSFLTLKLPFVYGVETNNGTLCPLNPFDQQPERTAWLCENTVLQLVSVGNCLLVCENEIK